MFRLSGVNNDQSSMSCQRNIHPTPTPAQNPTLQRDVTQASTPERPPRPVPGSARMVSSRRAVVRAQPALQYCLMPQRLRQPVPPAGLDVEAVPDLSLQVSSDSHCCGIYHPHACTYYSSTQVSTLNYNSPGFATYFDGFASRGGPRLALSSLGLAHKNLCEQFKRTLYYMKEDLRCKLTCFDQTQALANQKEMLMRCVEHNLYEIEQRFVEQCRIWGEIYDSLVTVQSSFDPLVPPYSDYGN